MTKREFEVVTEFGTFTRTSGRDYKYIVISRGCTLDTLVKAHTTEIAQTKKAFEKYNEIVISGVIPAEYASSPWATFEWYKETASDCAAKLAELEAAPAPIENTKYTCHQWSSRLDLAMREAGKLTNGKNAAKYKYADVRVIDVETGKEVA